jgi:hypothetical protein
MAKDPAARYGSMAELEAALAPYDSSEKAAAPAATSSAPVRGERMAAIVRPLLLILAGSGVLWVAGSLISLIVALIRLARVVAGRTANVGWPVWDVLLAVVGLGILIGVYRFSEKQREGA